MKRLANADLIAFLAIAGAVAVHEYIAAGVIVLMLTGGRALEHYASGRAGRELSALLARAPRSAHRYEGDALRGVGLDEVRSGDLLLIRPGDVVPVDGLVESEAAVLDESALTGEARPVRRASSDRVPSGVVNAGSAFDLRAIATADASTYAGIVRLVREAQTSRAPFVRLADRYALFFLPVAVVTAGLAWALSHDPVRAVAVLVVATPCPLILAAPVAIVGGISRAARRGVVIKNGGALEALGHARTLLVDKTGTLTVGMPAIASVEPAGEVGAQDLLLLAASLDQVSTHVLAAAIVRGARERGLTLVFPEDVKEHYGTGIEGTVDGRRVALGRAEWVLAGGTLSDDLRRIRRRASVEGASCVYVSVDGALAGMVVVDDPIRPETPATIASLRRSGIERVIVVSGDHPDVADNIGAAIGADLVLAERSPAEKVEAVRLESEAAVTVMVGDGINDAPALAAASVGVAMGARGASASSEAADVVITLDRLDRLAEAIDIARRARRIALQSVIAGMGLSAVAMGFAAAGWLRPVGGALLQEGIDIAVILNALRTLGIRRPRRVRPTSVELEIGERARTEHRELRPEVDGIRIVADRLEAHSPGSLTALKDLRHFLEHRLLPHEEHEGEAVYPVVARLLGGDAPTATMLRAHREIQHLVRVYGRLIDTLPPTGPGPEDLPDLRRVLYGLHATLRLHFAQEDETYLPLIDAAS